MIKNLLTTTATVFVLTLTLVQPVKAQYLNNSNIEHLYSGCGYMLAEIMYGTSATSTNLYSGCGYTLADCLY